MPESQQSPFKSSAGLTRVQRAFGYSMRGLAAALRDEHAFRQEAVLALILIPAALLLGIDALGKALMIASVLLVLIIELLNSAIEAVVDRVSLERHPLAARAKDLGSAAVFVGLVNVVVVWGLILWRDYVPH